MKHLCKILILLMVWATFHSAYGQADTSTCKSFSFGLSAGNLGDDSGIGVEISSPTFCNDRLCVRLKGNAMWLEQYKAVYDHWASYKQIGVSFAYNFKVVERSRFFMDVNPYMIFPDTKFSDVRSVQGIACSIGVEIFVVNTSAYKVTYYFSAGVAHSNAHAERLEQNPNYGGGFVFNNGLRFYFPTCRK